MIDYGLGVENPLSQRATFNIESMASRRTIIDSLHRCLCPQYFNSLPSVRSSPVAVQHLSPARSKGFSSSTHIPTTIEDAYSPSPKQDGSRDPVIRKLVTPNSVWPNSRAKDKYFGGTTVAFSVPDSEYTGLNKVIDLASRSMFPGVFLAAEELVRKHDYVPDAKLYTVLIEACANFPGCLLQGLAFRLLGEMKERNLVVGSVVYHNLLRVSFLVGWRDILRKIVLN